MLDKVKDGDVDYTQTYTQTRQKDRKTCDLYLYRK